MLRALFFFILTLLAVDLAPNETPGEGLPALLISAVPLILLAINQKKIFPRPLLDSILLSELFLYTLLFFYWVGVPHTFTAIILYLAIYYLTLGFGLNWHLALFLLPFCCPFLLFFAASLWLSPLVSEEIFLIVSLFLLSAIILLLPLLFQWTWRCDPLPSSALKERLEVLCKQFGFRHGGILKWNVMRNATTAAIIGVFPRFRYILFTDSLLKTFPEQEVEAVLAHEIGHAAHQHLLIYPFLFLGLPALAALLSPWIETSHPLIGYLVYATLLILYVRLLIGFFSRQFERQADLHVFALGLPPATLITALNRISQLNSLPLKKQNWHHGSLAARINFLKRAEADPHLVKKHHRRVRCYLLAFLLINLFFWTCWIYLN